MALFTTKKIEFIDKRESATTILNKKAESFVVYITALLVMSIYPSKQT